MTPSSTEPSRSRPGAPDRPVGNRANGDRRVPLPADADCSGLTPAAIVRELDRHIVGQNAAKRAVAIALRNRWRRRQVPSPLREEIQPNNILMIGPTGVGKTEIARRLAGLARAPFLKVEASRYTEVGYVGRDVESIARDLVESAAAMVRRERLRATAEVARARALDRLRHCLEGRSDPGSSTAREITPQLRRLERDLERGQHDGVEVEIVVPPRPVDHGSEPILPGMWAADLAGGLREMLSGTAGGMGLRPRRLSAREAFDRLVEAEGERLLDPESVGAEALERAQASGIVFIDEIDKICGGEGGEGPDVSREGVQRDILPIVEGSAVATRFGTMRTEHVLFIAAGAFHVASPADLIPELQGRFPIRVELSPLREEDLARILVEPEGALCRQYAALLAADGIRLSFDPEAVKAIAGIAAQVNERTENIGARRLHTVLTTLLEDVLFDAPLAAPGKSVRITAARVRKRLGGLIQDEDLSRYVL